MTTNEVVPVRLAVPEMAITRDADGTIRARAKTPLGAYPARLTARLEHWAELAPDRVFLAERTQDGTGWRRITYAETLAAVTALGQALLDRDLSPDRPIAILSGNGIDHALLGLAAQHVGVPYAPISVAYSTSGGDFARLRHILALLTPGLVFAEDGARFAPALAIAAAGSEIVVSRNPPPGRAISLFADLLATRSGAAVAAAAERVGPETIAKFLFTSGSTDLPKGVINTQRMLCSNQAMILSVMRFLGDEPPMLLDWLPWNHTFGGNHNFGIALYNGGTLYIDDGRPVAGGIAATLRNLREIAPNVYFNVPKGWEEIALACRDDAALRARFFSRAALFFYAGASLAQHVWDLLDDLAIATIGRRVTMLTGLGATETAPFALCCHPSHARSGMVGVPAPGVELKLAKVEGKWEARLRGPSITPGYWRDAAKTRAAFDEEGFYRTGDALDWIDPETPAYGFRFDGRIAEDFKLSSGTWVHVGRLRALLLERLAPHVRDVVIAAPDRDAIAVLALPERAEYADDAAIRAEIARRLAAFARDYPGSSMRVARLAFLTDPLSVDAGEITDKGSLNQRAILRNRPALIDRLYAEPASLDIITVEEFAA
ncbi:MAG: feruloyl-CoA synthase [Acidibrevibacterium sp.]|jgi:feruloyl-CoA synthase|uniref:feruloyl-CoA synthase n=1 Tax=Acidibrevibacterium fodinaquatile TaxID=1969806 RepID=UPI0023A8F927|nr:feruloyl-CoA synthase [Acidibrevibacterium fodinaquatile]MCA7118683.1 feruloyl-CoA synthase [Acidibrevibacterium fodinaquatile]